MISDEPVVVESLQPTDSGQEAAEESSAPVTEDVPAASDAPLEVVNPVMGDTVSVFSVDTLTYDETLGDWRTHDGLDIQATAGTAVAAAAAGTVLSVTEDGLLGTMVVIDHHNGYTTTYASLEPETKVLAGDEVSAGTVIGTVGNTSLSEAGLGAHLHFAVAKDGEPVDPAGFLEGKQRGLSAWCGRALFYLFSSGGACRRTSAAGGFDQRKVPLNFSLSALQAV